LLIALAASVVSFGSADALVGESPDGPEHVVVYMSLDEALSASFSSADSVWSEAWSPVPEARRLVERRLGWRLSDSTFTIYQGSNDGLSLGYGFVAEEIGLYKPITFMVKVGPNHKVESVHVMVYRESRGGEVRRRRFLKQYEGKSTKSRIRINRDIVGVSGATLSVRAMNAGVKKALALIDAAYPVAEEK
jgi:thiamine biosynthesis lipoprotein